MKGANMTNRQKILGSVSAIALSVVAVSGARANDLNIVLAVPPGVTVNNSSANITSEQVNGIEDGDPVSVESKVSTAYIGTPGSTLGVSDDFKGGTDNISVDGKNQIFALTEGNVADTGANFFLSTGSGDTSGITSGSLQLNDGISITAEAKNVDIQADIDNLGPNSSVSVSTNTITATGLGNDAKTLVGGDINPLQSSTEVGAATINGAFPVVASGSALAGSMQVNTDGVLYEATVDGARIGALVQNLAIGEFQSTPVTVSDNTIESLFTGNAGATTVALTAGKDLGLEGAAGVVNAQSNDGDFTIASTVNGSVIEIGDTQNYPLGGNANHPGVEYLTYLNAVPTTLDDNTISAGATSNTAANTLTLADGISQTGTGTGSTQLNAFDTTTDQIKASADLFIANGQYSDVGVDAEVTDSALNLLIESAAVNGSTVSVQDNTLSASANGSAVVNTLDVGKATALTSTVAVDSVQYTEGDQTAVVDADIKVQAATVGLQSYGYVASSPVTVDNNTVSSSAIGNKQDTGIDLTATSATITGVVAPAINADRTTTSGNVTAGYSILSAQVLDGGDATSAITTIIDVDAATHNLTNSNVSVSSNRITGQAIGNLSTDASISIDANSLVGTAGVASAQTVEDGSLLQSTIAGSGGTALIDVDIPASYAALPPDLVTNSAVHVDNNIVSSSVRGNFVDEDGNALTITGGSASDGTVALPSASVDRTAAVTDTDIVAGFGLLNDQSVEDLNGSVVTATITGDLINVLVGSDTAQVTNSPISADKNSGLTTATLNDATSALSVDVTTLNASSNLTNVQSLADQDGTPGSAQVNVSQNDVDITVDLLSGGIDLTNSTASVSQNTLAASAAINVADNSVNVKATNQTISNAIATGTDNKTVQLSDAGSTVNAETSLVNDQSYTALGAGGVTVSLSDDDVTLDVNSDGFDIVGGTFTVDANKLTAYVGGNDATNTLTTKVGNYDLTTADNGTPGNGPVAALTSNQSGTAGDASGALATNITDATVATDLNSEGTVDNITNTNATASSNVIRALSRANNVVNTLSASGTDFVVTPVSAGDIDGVIDTADVNQIQLEETSFAVASRQVNSIDVASTVSGSTVSIDAVLADGDITGSHFDVNLNQAVSEARGSDAVNTGTIDFAAENQANGTVANLQYADQDVTYTAQTTGTEFSVLTGGDFDNGSISVSGNGVAAFASGNTATNTLTSAGNNIALQSGGSNVAYDTTGTAKLDDTSALSVLNVQGASDIDNAVDVDVSASVSTVLIGTIAGVAPTNETFGAGSLTVDNNQVLAQASQHTATNALNINADANITSDEDNSASVVSVQNIGDGSVTSASISDVGIGALTDDPRSPSAFSASASGNEVSASSIGGDVSNSLRVTAGNINVAAASGPTVIDGTGSSASAGFDVLNIQQAVNANFTAGVTGVAIAAGAAEDLNNDAVTVSNNAVSADAQGFNALNILTLNGKSGVDTTAAVTNYQALNGDTGGQTPVGLVTASIANVGIGAVSDDEGAIGSALNVTQNTVEATAGGNQAINAMQVDAGASLAGSVPVANGSTNVGTGLLVNADYAVLNDQSNDTMSISAAVSSVAVGIDGLEATTGVDSSALNVAGNIVTASATGNNATNQLVLNSGTYTYPTGAVSNLQSNVNTPISASVSNVAIGIGGFSTISAQSDNSSLSVSGNSIGATAIGNSAVNRLTTSK